MNKRRKHDNPKYQREGKTVDEILKDLSDDFIAVWRATNMTIVKFGKIVYQDSTQNF